MFHSFFPRPKLFFLSFTIWALLCVIFWFAMAINLGNQFSLGGTFGFQHPTPLADEVIALAKSPPAKAAQPAKPDPKAGDSNASDAGPAAKPKPSPEQLAAKKELAAFEEEYKRANNFWFYQYTALAYFLFVAFWMWFSPHKWARWSVMGSALIVFATWFQVQIDVMINEWFGRFYDTIQKALGKANSVSVTEYYGHLITFGKIALVAVIVGVLTRFFISHYIFRWRTAMNDYYMARWERVRHIEGASQRVQEDTMRFASIMESLGVALLDSLMTLIAFLPILWTLSAHVKVLPLIGEVPHALVFVAIIWAVLGTAMLAAAGIKLPGLEFRNQRVEAAYRKELVYGEDDHGRAAPPTVRELFGNVRRNYFRLYFHYMYFNVVRISYLQAGVLVPYIALGPTIVAGGFTLGIMQQIVRAFQRVESSFQFLVHSWTTIVELLSIHKRLQAFEAAINDQPLPDIDREFLERDGVGPGGDAGDAPA